MRSSKPGVSHLFWSDERAAFIIADLADQAIMPDRQWRGTCDGTASRRMRRRAWEVAIDWHLQPYYGQPKKSRNDSARPAEAGATKVHAYASACIVEYGRRYTLALTWMRRHESMVVVLRRLVARIREIGLKIKCVLVDRAFFNVPVVEFLQEEELPFLMPVVIRGWAPKKGRKVTGLRWIKRQPAGWYPHTIKSGKRQVIHDVEGHRAVVHVHDSLHGIADVVQSSGEANSVRVRIGKVVGDGVGVLDPQRLPAENHGHRLGLVARLLLLESDCHLSNLLYHAGIEASPSDSHPAVIVNVLHNQEQEKADVAEYPKVFRHVGLLVDEPPGTTGLLFI